MAFTHLHVHSDYSADGLSPVNDLVMRAKALGMEGIALTDHGTLAGVPEFVAKCQNEGLKPIIGCEFWITDHQGLDVKEKELRKPFHLILLAKDAAGYRNLVRLSSISNDEGLIRGKPHITHELLERYHEGLICSSACIGGEVPQGILKGDAGRAAEAARWYRDLFGDDFYLEVSLHKPHARTVLSRADDRASWKARNRELVSLQERADEGIFALGRELGIKVVATNDVHFSGRDDALAQDVVLCTNAGKKVSDPDRLRYSHQEYVKNEAEMLHLFPDHPEAIANTMEVLSKVESFSIRGDVVIPRLCDDPAGRLRTLATAGARQRYGSLRPALYLCYDRTAYFSRETTDLRVTFDRNIGWRQEAVRLTAPAGGAQILPRDTSLMEIKAADAIPLWLASLLSEKQIRQTSFSKYGEAYKTILALNRRDIAGGIAYV